MNIKCEICPTIFSWTKVGSAGQPPKICEKPECKAIKSRQYYLKWKAAHPSKLKQNGIEQAKRRKKKQQPAYFSKDVPETKIYQCQRCGKLTVNRFNCPTCLHILTEGISQEYQEYIFMDGNFEGLVITPTGSDRGFG